MSRLIDAHHAVERERRRVRDEPARALQPFLLGRERDEDQVPHRLLAREHARELEHHGHAAGVVVGARVDLPLVAGVRVGPAAAEVVVVRRDDGRLSLPVGAGAGHVPDHVPRLDGAAVRPLRHREALEPGAPVAAGPQAAGLEAAGDVAGGLVEAGRAQPAALERGRGEPGDVALERLAREDRRQGRERLRRVRRERGQRGGARAGGAQVHDERRVGRLPLARERVDRLLALEGEVGVLAVVRQLPPEPRQRRGRVGRDPADRLLGVRRVAHDEHDRVVRERHAAPLDRHAVVVDRHARLAREQLRATRFSRPSSQTLRPSGRWSMRSSGSTAIWWLSLRQPSRSGP